MAKTKFIRVAVAGFTASDGRTIEPHWLNEMAANYNPATYTARVNVEHIRNLSADGPFPALGDVLALKVQTDDIEIAGKKESRVALYAQIEGNDVLQKYVAADQKKFTSIEIEPNFSGSGKAYLLGLAATDTPASLGTEALKFSMGQDAYAQELKSILDARKKHSTCLFSAALETQIEFETANPGAATPDSFLDKLFTGLEARLAPKKEEPKPAVPATPADPAVAFTAMFGDFAKDLKAGLEQSFAAQSQANQAAIAKVTSEFAALKADIEKTPAPGQFTRTPATGGDGVELADC